MTNLSEKEWKNLLSDIERRSVIPIIGPAAVSAWVDGEDVLLYPIVGPRLAAELDVEIPPHDATINRAARQFMFKKGGPRSTIYSELRQILADYSAPGAALCALASIEDIELYVSSTPDELLALALKQKRNFDSSRQQVWFEPVGKSDDRRVDPSGVASQCDLPMNTPAPILHQLLGSTRGSVMAVWEEDYMEFVFGLIQNSVLIERLSAKLCKSNLLLIGAPSEDWIVRFLLRIARGNRLSDSADTISYLADDGENLKPETPMTFFFEQATKSTRVIRTEPRAFALELAQRWHAHKQARAPIRVDEFFARQPELCPKDTVFISYAKEDRAHVAELGTLLERASVPVWVDKRHLSQGENYERALQGAVMDCSFFISLISPRTEAEGERYFHKERAWAAQRFTEGTVFYLPLLVDLPRGSSIQREPAAFHKIERDRFEAASLPGFVAKLRSYLEVFRRGQRPRG